MFINKIRSLSFFFLFFAIAHAKTPLASIKGPECSVPLSTLPECTRCNFEQWAKKISNLKERPIQFSSLPAQIDYEKNILTLKEFLTTLQQAADVIEKTLESNDAWLSKKSLAHSSPDLFKLERPYTKPASDVKNFPFKPYAQRLILKDGARAALFGDLHGSIHSLIRDLKKLQQEKLLDNNFTITDKNFYMAFLGDYIDRGIYGVEVVYTLARLKIANPHQVILVRGNHEDYILAPEFLKRHTKEEQKDNAPSFITELYRKFKMSEKDEVTIFRFYELLPVVLYIGSRSAEPQKTVILNKPHEKAITDNELSDEKDLVNAAVPNNIKQAGVMREPTHIDHVVNAAQEKIKNHEREKRENTEKTALASVTTKSHCSYMQCCHGGIEIGYNPYHLLHAPAAITFEEIKLLKRKNNVELLSEKSQSAIKNAFPIDVLCKELSNFTPLAPFYLVPGTNHVSYFGLLWNDFYVDPQKIVGERASKPGGKIFRGWTIGKELALDYFKLASSDFVTLEGIFRAHQHNNETGGPMLNKVCCGKGITNIWNKDVYTLVSAPDSKLEDTGQMCFTYDSFLIITIAPEFKDWKMVHYWQDNGMETRKWQTRNLKEENVNSKPEVQPIIPAIRKAEKLPVS